MCAIARTQVNLRKFFEFKTLTLFSEDTGTQDGKTVNRNIVWNFGNFSTNKGFPLLLGSREPVSKRDVDSRYSISKALEIQF